MSTSPILESKDPSDIKDYDIDLADVLTGESETAIASATWGVSSPAGLTVLTAAPHAAYISGTKAVVWVSGGTHGVTYELTCMLVTAGATPRTHQRTIVIPCVNR